jgi:hypothetical protein
MTRKTILGLAFKIWSPSLLELEARDDGADISQVVVSYNGAWWISVLMKLGHSHHRGPFKRRDDAIGLIADRVARLASAGELA